ncbi:MAG: Inner membrane transport protein YajR [Actinobacteria bacterium ADurb.BinA094]|nr:MAG: Inner membrane transport protein YajR [Actinobacteria bacterium ADurb.BinA094]
MFTRDFSLAILANLFSFASMYVLLATLPLYVVAIGGTVSDAGVVLACFTLSAVVVRPVVGRLSDRRAKKAIMLAGAVILAVSSLLYAPVHSVPLLMAVRVFHGVGWAAFGTAASALAADLAPLSRRGEAMGYFGVGMNVAMAIGPALGVFLVGWTGYGSLFLTAMVLGAAAALTTAGIAEPRRAPGRGALQRGWRSFILPSALFPSAVLFTNALTYASVVALLPLFADEAGLGNPGLFFTVFSVVVLVLRGPLGRVSDRRGRVTVVAPGLSVTFVALLVLSQAQSTTTMLVVAVLYAVGVGAAQPTLMAMTVDRAGPQERGAAMGTYTTAMDLGIGVGSVVWGVVAQSLGFAAMYVAASLMGLVGVALLLAGAAAGRSRAAA